MSLEDLLKSTTGDDISTVVGRGVMEIQPGRIVHYAAFVADYGDCKGELSKIYTSLFSTSWEDATWEQLRISRTAEDTVHVETVARTMVIGIEAGEQHRHSGPHFWVTAQGASKPCVDEFFALAQDSGYWVLCLQTLDACYMFVIEHPSGKLAHRRKGARLEIRPPEKGEVHDHPLKSGLGRRAMVRH